MSSFTPQVSVIIPVYNGAETIAACLESLLCQNYPESSREIIVVENGSTDNTAAVVSAYPVRLLTSDSRGPAAARNYGIHNSQSELVAFTDDDCIADPNWLAELVKPYVEPTVGATGGEIHAYPQPEWDILDRFAMQFPPLVNFWSGDNEYLPHLYTANASYRRAALEELGGFNPRLITGEDVELSWRLQLDTHWKVAYAPAAAIYHRHRMTQAGLIRQFRQYGYGEILLDTLFRHRAGYPRRRRYQIGRVFNQVFHLPLYGASIVLRNLRYLAGRADRYDIAMPRLRILVEGGNILGKLEALWDTRLMTNPKVAFRRDPAATIRKFF